MFQLLLVIIYLAFISLGLPDSLFGSSWPTMVEIFNVPLSYAGIITMTIAAGTILSSLQSDRLTKKFSTAKVTAVSVLMTAIALFGFSISNSFWMLCLWAIPYGLGAGSVDASLNNYVALHYESRHMSWLHCMWGVGATLGPTIMGFALSNNQGWAMGYRYVSIIQIVLSVILFISLPLWKINSNNEEIVVADSKVLTIKEILRIKGTKEVMIMFFCYCALESTAGLWASSYLVLYAGISTQLAATFASMFFMGITIGRGFSGFLTMKFNDSQMIRIGQGLILFGILCVLLPIGNTLTLIGLVIIGLGCAPIYPCIIHSTPAYFGAENSQAIIGVQMAAAYVGACLMPPLFGLIANYVNIALFPTYLLIILMLMFLMHENLIKKCKK